MDLGDFFLRHKKENLFEPVEAGGDASFDEDEDENDFFVFTNFEGLTMVGNVLGVVGARL